MIKEIFYSEFVEEKPSRRTVNSDSVVSSRVVIDEDGREVLDKTPISIPIPVLPSPSSMFELVHRLYREMQNQECETFADAEDFDVPDELGIEMRNTPYEQDFDHVAVPAEPAPQPSAVPAEPDKSQEVNPA